MLILCGFYACVIYSRHFYLVLPVSIIFCCFMVTRYAYIKSCVMLLRNEISLAQWLSVLILSGLNI